MTAQRKPRRPRLLRARPLLVAVGAAALLAGCDDDTTATTNYDLGLPPIHDMAKPAITDLTPPTD